MRVEVTIPDKVYSQAQRAAIETGVSFDSYITEAVTLHLEVETERPLKLTGDQIATIRQSQAEIKAGKGKTMAQVEESLAEKRAAWLQANPS